MGSRFGRRLEIKGRLQAGAALVAILAFATGAYAQTPQFGAPEASVTPAAAPEPPPPPPPPPPSASDGSVAPAAPEAALPAAPPPSATPADSGVQVQSLAQLDLFSTGRDTGLGPELWKGASGDLARAVIPALDNHPLSPAGVGLARRLLAAAASAPQGAGSDTDLAGARISALLALGASADAASIASRTPNLSGDAGLSHAAAEAALVTEQDDRACSIADALQSERDAPYWLRLRAFCQARAGRAEEAQLTFTLAQQRAKDPIYARLMGVVLAGSGDPGPASLRDGLDYALSRTLKLDLGAAAAGASPAVLDHLAPSSPSLPQALATDPAASPADQAIAQALRAVLKGETDPMLVEALVDEASAETAPKARARLISAALVASGLEGFGPHAHAAFAALPPAKAAGAKALALDLASDQGLKGAVGLLALSIAEDAGAGGPAPLERAEIERGLARVGLKDDAQAFAAEGLAALLTSP